MSNLLKNYCVQILLLMKEGNFILPELVKIIVYYVYHLHFNHKLIFYDNVDNAYAGYVEKGWRHIKSIVERNYPYMTLYHIEDSNYNEIPFTIRNLIQFCTMLIFVSNDYCNDSIDNTEIGIYNGYVVPNEDYGGLYNRVRYIKTYDYGEVESYWTWILNCIDSAFIKDSTK